MASEFWIVVDWGSTNGRAWLLAGHEVLDSTEWSQGILFGNLDQKRDFLGGQLDPWTRRHRVKVILGVGMLGSRSGLLEVNYLSVPVTRDSWASASEDAGLVNEVPIRIVPGVCTMSTPFGLASVLRGEESKFFGAIDIASEAGVEFDVLVTPGTHSKWIVNSNKSLQNFETFPTGELFEQWRYRSSLSSLIPEDADVSSSGFAFGLDVAARQASLSSSLFSLRAEVMLGRLDPHDLLGALSGTLIGIEVRDGSSVIGADKKFAVAGGDTIAPLYSDAFEHFGIANQLIAVGPADFSRHFVDHLFVEESA